MCTPPKIAKNSDIISTPKGESRANLAEMGLISKISLESTWSAVEVENEIKSVFMSAFNLRDDTLLTTITFGNLFILNLTFSFWKFLLINSRTCR